MFPPPTPRRPAQRRRYFGRLYGEEVLAAMLFALCLLLLSAQQLLARGLMRMMPVEDGMEVPAGGTLLLEPSGHHLAFIGLTEPLKEGR